MESGKLKKLNGNQVVDVPLPASVYDDFAPKFLAVSSDNTIYLRAGNGIKIIKNNKVVKFYEFGPEILIDFINLPPPYDDGINVSGEHEIAFNEYDGSIYFGFDPFFEDPSELGEIKKNGEFRYITPARAMGPYKGIFDLGPSQGYGSATFWFVLGSRSGDIFRFNGFEGNQGDSETSLYISFPRELEVQTLVASKTNFSLAYYISYQQISEGIGTLNKIEIDDDQPTPTKPTKTIYIADVALKNNRMALSYDNKTLYVAGDGLFKIEFEVP